MTIQGTLLRHQRKLAKFEEATATTFDAGSSGTAGSVDVFPATAAKGKLAITCADQTGDTTVTLTTAAMAAARTVTIPDPGASASFVMTEGTQMVNGVTTFSDNLIAGGELRLGNGPRVFTGEAETRATVRALVGDDAPIGSIFVGSTSVATTKPNLYVKMTDVPNDTDWERVVTAAVD